MASNRDVGALQSGSGIDVGALQSPASGPQTVSPGGIATGFSAGTPHFIGPPQTVDPGGIPTGFSAGTPNLGGNQIITFPSGVPTGIRIGVPNVGGPVSVNNGVPTGFSTGTPLMRQQVVLGFNGIPTGFSAGSPKLFHSQTISFSSGIPTGFSAGTPTFVPGAKKIAFGNFDGVPTGFKAGPPNLVGGGAGLHVYIAGKDVSSQFQGNQKAGILRAGASGGNSSSAGSAQPMNISSQTIGRWTATFDLIDYDGSLDPENGQTVLITEPGYRHMGGCLTKVEMELVQGTSAVIYHLTARDKSAICDRRVVKVASYPAGMDIADVFRAIVRDYMAGEGFTTANVPATLGALDADFVLPGQLPYVTQAFDALVTLYQGVWWIDSFGDLHTPLIANIPSCPYSIAEPTTNAIRGLRMISDSAPYANVVYAVSNLKVIPGTSSGNSQAPPNAATASITETYTLPQAQAAALGYVLGSILTKFPIRVVTGLKVNGVAQPIHLGSENINFRHSWWYFPGAPNNFIIPPAAQNVNPFPDPPITSADPTIGDVVEVDYIPDVPLAGNDSGSPLNPSGPGTGTCGSGIWEKVEQVQNVQYQGDLDIIAAALLSRDGLLQKQLIFESDIPGAVVGSKIHVDRPRLKLPNTDMMITNVQGASQQGVDIGHGSCFRWTITAVNGADQGNYLKFWERIIARTQLPQPIDQLVLPTIIAAPGVDLSSGNIDTNPLIVPTTCEATTVAVACFVGPIDQDALVMVFVKGVPILAAPIVIPGGTASLVVIKSSNMATPGGFWCYQDQTVTSTVTYRVTGPNPQPAQSLTIQVRGHY